MVKRALVVVGVGLGAVVAAGAGFAAWVAWRPLPRYPVERVEVRVEPTAERVARGRDLSVMLCASCHLDPATRRLSGKRMPDVPPELGVIHAPNITRHPERGIEGWTDGEILHLLRTGIRRDGRYAPPYMVKMPRAADEDLAAILAFLRSDDPLVAPTDARVPEPQPSFLVKLLSRVAWKPLPYPKAPLAAPDPSDRVAWGRYLANDLLDCYSCHSADFKTVDPLHPERSEGFYQGGNRMLDASGREIFTTNLTPDRETGIGAWSEDEFVRALRGGLRPDGSAILYPMLPYAALGEEDARAIHAYLQTLAPVAKSRPRAARAAAPAATPGRRAYEERGCLACHGETGIGLHDLRHAALRYPSDGELAAFIRDPGSRVPGIAMPAYGEVIPEAEMADLLAHVRSLQVQEER